MFTFGHYKVKNNIVNGGDACNASQMQHHMACLDMNVLHISMPSSWIAWMTLNIFSCYLVAEMDATYFSIYIGDE